MELETVLATMASNAQVIAALVQGCSHDQARWRPDLTSWSVLEVVVHLLDEEREDFRARIDAILFRPQEPWFRIDPGAWVVERGYNQREFAPSLGAFLAARAESLDWLRGLQSPDWDQAFDAPFGPIRAGDILASWVAHDVLHTRQLVELRWAHLKSSVTPYDSRYAGDW